jgi:cytochrome P450
MATAPGLTQWLPLPYGRFKEFLRDMLGFQLRARERFGDVFRFQIGPLLVHFLYHPDYVRHVLHDHQKNYPRGWHYRLLRRLMGNNLVVSEGEFWLRQRRLAQPAFQRGRLAEYLPVMVDATSQMLDRWEQAASAGTVVDVAAEMSRLALAIAGSTFFGRDVSDTANVVGQAFREAAAYLERRFNHPFTTPPLWVPTGNGRRFKEALRTLNRIVLALLKERRSDGRDHGDLLSMLMHARDEETGATMTDDELRSEVLAFFLAGHETTATALTWTWFLLASHPAIQKQVQGEVVQVLGGRPPTVADVPRLTLTRMVIEESMRLYPPVWAVARQAAQDDELGGFRIPAGSTIVVSPFVTHRHPDIWERPDEFDPSRFTPERVAQRPKCAYFPFLSGPHQCIGNEFAMLEMRLIVAIVMEQYDMELQPGQAIRPQASLGLKPSGPVRILLRRRDNHGAVLARPPIHAQERAGCNE